MSELTKARVAFHPLGGDQRAESQAACGSQREEWTALKVCLAGSMEAFARL